MVKKIAITVTTKRTPLAVSILHRQCYFKVWFGERLSVGLSMIRSMNGFYKIFSLEGGEGGGGSRWIFDVMLGSGKKIVTVCTYIFAWKCTHFTEMYRKFRPKMHPSLWNLHKILPQIVPICMPYAGQILFKDVPFYRKFVANGFNLAWQIQKFSSK